MKPYKFITIMILAIVFASGTYNEAVSQMSARQIIEKMEDQMRGESAYLEMTMTTVRPRYTRDVGLKIWEKGGQYSLILITAPARDKGTAYLKRGKEIWSYVPRIDRMIKMPPSMMSQSWMGSDFSNDDLVRESSSISDYKHRIVREEKYQGRDAWVLELIPKPESSIVFGKVLIWVDKEHFIQLKIENYDEDGSLASSILFSDIRNIGGRMLPGTLEMIPADKKNQRTIMKYENARFNLQIQDSFFSVQNLKNVK
jgi:outer membrane lipoprotein-sorting protein